VSLPGYFTPSEAFAALEAGATGLKLFPAEAATPAVLKAQRAVIPRETTILVVGGINPDNMAPWREVGADGFGLASALYRPGDSAVKTGNAARRFVASLSGGTRP
jgi:2-dehydro-3-deoxyphosphogalactonate aldolase